MATFPVEVRGGDVWVKPTFAHADPAAHWRRRLANGLAHNIGLVIAKAVHGQLAIDTREQVQIECGGDAEGIIVGISHHRNFFFNICSQQQRIPRLEDRSHLPQKSSSGRRFEIADGAA